MTPGPTLPPVRRTTALMTFPTRKAAGFAEPARRSTDQNWSVARAGSKESVAASAGSLWPGTPRADLLGAEARTLGGRPSGFGLRQSSVRSCNGLTAGGVAAVGQGTYASATDATSALPSGKSRMRGRPTTDTTRNRHSS